jgi:hypothetical protein
MNHRKNLILYLALGDRCINQAIFSIITLINTYEGKAFVFKIIVYTDNPDAFLWLSDNFPVESVCISQDRINEWCGIHRQLLRAKIKVIQEVINSADANLLFVDTDTFFLKKVDTLFDKIGKGVPVMHVREWRMSIGRKLHSELCPQDLDFDLKSGFNVKINDATLMWNSGVIGISSIQKNEIDAVLEINDSFYQINPSWHVEQLSFSVILNRTLKLIGCNNIIFHYWHNKEVVDEYIKNLRFVETKVIPKVLSRTKKAKAIFILIILVKYKSLQFKKTLRSLSHVYRLYLFIKPILKYFGKRMVMLPLDMKQLLKRIVPSALWPSPYLLRLVMERSNACVIAGPFKGLQYLRESFGIALYPKILGCYERELHPAVNEIIASGFDRIVDVGAAEGYYAVGLAMRCPRIPVVAFESAGEGRMLLREMAQLNRVSDHLDIRAACNPVELARVLESGEGRHLLICDCEGYEDALLDLDEVPALRNATILVELHEFLCRGISQRIRSRFESSHTIEEIRAEKRHADEFPISTLYTRLMPRKYLVWAVSEGRPEGMNWFWMKSEFLAAFP